MRCPRTLVEGELRYSGDMMAGTLFRSGIACLPVCLLLSGCAVSKAGSKGLEQELANAVPLKSSPAQVIDYLNSKKIKHSKYHRDETLGNEIEAEISVKSGHTMVDPSYDVAFRFDDHDQLFERDVQFLGYIGL
jgi:hypothetical protein